MLSLFFAATLPLLNVGLDSKQCLGSSTDTTNCVFYCFDVTIPAMTPYPIADVHTKITNGDADAWSIADIGLLCPNIKLAADIYGECTVNNLVWPDDECSCPSCPCDTASTPADQPFYSSSATFFDQSCVECTCEEKNAGSGVYGFSCWSYGGDEAFQMNSYTTTTSFEAFQCPPAHTCSDGNNWPIYMDGDGYWDHSQCDTFCYCDSTEANGFVCRTGYESILGTHDALRAAFINRCGEEIPGCLNPSYYANLASKPLDTANGETCANSGQDCPICTCDTDGTQWIVEAEDYKDTTATRCISCMCLAGESKCDEGEAYRNDRLTCDGTGTSCYFGVSIDAERTASVSATLQGNCPAEQQCGWSRKANPFDDQVENRWGCVDSVFCDVLGVDGTCVHASGSITPSYFGCSDIMDPFTFDEYLYCCSGADCNQVDIPADLADATTGCAESTEWTTMFTNLFTCLVGTGITNFDTIPLNYNILKCDDPLYVKDLSSCFPIGGSEGWTYNMHDYLKWTYGCSCGAVSYFYGIADAATKQTLEAMKDDLILNLAQFSGENPVEWMDTLSCNIESVECDLDTGDVYLKAAACDMVHWNAHNKSCMAQCFQVTDNSYTYQAFFDPQHELSFDILQNVCPGVGLMVDQGLCTESDLIWPDDECGCPYCGCSAEGWIDSTVNEVDYFFGHECSACYCKAVTGGYGAYCYEGFGDGEYPWDAPETPASWDGFECPPDLTTTCTNHGVYYMPGQTFYDIDSAEAANDTNAQFTDVFCICNSDGTSTCETGYAAILASTNEDLLNQFLIRCGENLKGCLADTTYTTILPRSDDNHDCPVCGCDDSQISSFPKVWVVEEPEYGNPAKKRCRSCLCANADSNVDCDDGSDTYEVGDETCPPVNTQSCYHGASQKSGNFSDFVGTTSGCDEEDDLYCAWEYSEMFFDEPTWSRSCKDRVMCESFGITDGATCIKTEQTLTLGIGCGVFADIFGTEQMPFVQAIGCCADDDCNNGDIDVSTCAQSDGYDAFVNDFFGCIAGKGTWDWICPDGGSSEVTCNNIKTYLEYVKGCACTTAYGLYTLEGISDTLKDYLLSKLPEFMDSASGFDNNDAMLWAEKMGCGIGPAVCDPDTGDVTFTPSKCDAVNWYAPAEGYCSAQCVNIDDDGEYVWVLYANPQDEMPFDMIQSACPAVGQAVDAGVCTEDDLVWPSTECECPYCPCDTEGWVTDTVDEVQYFFGRECNALYCDGTTFKSYEGFGDDSYPESFQTAAQGFVCPPDLSTVCENHDNYYLPGQSFYDIDAAKAADAQDPYYTDIFCICDPDGTGDAICEDGSGGYEAILEHANGDLVDQFLVRCGEDLAGCLSDRFDQIISRADSHDQCPSCGCDAASVGSVWVVEEVDPSNPESMVCQTCVCVAEGKVECDSGDAYESGSKTCGPTGAKSCYHGVSEVSGLFSDMVGEKTSCAEGPEDDMYCGWEYQATTLDDNPTWSRSCKDRVMCEAFGITDGATCIKSDQQVEFAIYCGMFQEYFGLTEINFVNAISCCTDDDCNAEFNGGAFDVDQCETSEGYEAFFGNFYACLTSEDMWPWTCVDGATSELTCENLQTYLEYVKGCACTAGYDLYQLADVDLKAYLDEKVQQFIDSASSFGTGNAASWNTELGCNFVATCDLESGTITVDTTLITNSPTNLPTNSPGISVTPVASGVASTYYIDAIVWIGFVLFLMQ